jgi:hypothetical protein
LDRIDRRDEIFVFSGFLAIYRAGTWPGAVSYVAFEDPDGNTWIVQEVTHRAPGRIDPAKTTFVSANDLASAIRRAEAAHGEHEKRDGQRDANWANWYATYMAAEQAGTELPK